MVTAMKTESHHDLAVLIRHLRRFRARCPDCHLAGHFGLAQILDRGDVARAHLARVNGLSPSQVEGMLDRAFELWRWRSTFVCLTDLGTLGRGGTLGPSQW